MKNHTYNRAAGLVRPGLAVLLAAVALSGLISLAAYAAPGDLDPAFGGGGITITPTGGAASDLALQPDGKIVAGGKSGNDGNYNFTLARYQPDGRLDAGFGLEGLVTTSISSGNDTISAIARQTDGKIAAVGRAYNNGLYDLALARYTLSGTLDAGFGGSGVVTLSLNRSASASDIALQADGKIVIAGDFSLDDVTVNRALILARYTASGTLDASFGSAGIVTTTVSDSTSASALGIQPDGKIVVTGYSNTSGGAVLLRYDSNGSLDPTFGVGGIVTTATMTSHALAIQPDGNILVAGNSANKMALMRYTASGVLDSSFGSNGSVTTIIGSSADAYALTLQPDGKIVAAGQCGSYPYGDFALARYHSDGNLDASFGDDGIVITPIRGGRDYSYAVALQPNGKIVAAGGSQNDDGFDFALARYEPDGCLDATFGSGHIIAVPFSDSGDYGRTVAVQPDGKIVAVVDIDYNNYFTLIRYQPSGALDTSFGNNGIVSTSIGPTARNYALALQPDGKIVIGGYAYTPDYTARVLALVRYEHNGQPDSTFGYNGVITNNFGNFASAMALAIQADGKLVTAGALRNGGVYNLLLARYTPSGALDTSFGSGGVASLSIGNENTRADAVAIQPDGKIVVAGYAGVQAALLRFTTDGELDANFGAGGVVTAAIASEAWISNIELQPDGKIVTAIDVYSDTEESMALARYTLSGTLDSSFGSGGMVTTFGRNSSARALLIQADGKIVVGGSRGSYPQDDMALARYESDGQLDTSFGAGGWVSTPAGNSRINSAALQSDGKIVVVGHAYNEGTFQNFVLARYDTRVPGSAAVGTDLVAVGDTNVKARFTAGGPCTLAVTKTIAFPHMKTVVLPNEPRGDPGEMPMYWEIKNDCPGAYEMELALCYTDGELSHGISVTETSLAAFKHAGGQVWSAQGGTVVTNTQCVSLTGVTDLSYWSLGDVSAGQAGPTLLGLSAFTTPGRQGTAGPIFLALAGGLLALCCAYGWATTRRKKA